MRRLRGEITVSLRWLNGWHSDTFLPHSDDEIPDHETDRRGYLDGDDEQHQNRVLVADRASGNRRKQYNQQWLNKEHGYRKIEALIGKSSG